MLKIWYSWLRYYILRILFKPIHTDNGGSKEFVKMAYAHKIIHFTQFEDSCGMIKYIASLGNYTFLSTAIIIGSHQCHLPKESWMVDKVSL